MYRRVCPSDLEQREGRIIRQGNKNKQVRIFRYVTESTFDSFSWQLIENKQKFIGQIMTSKSPVRSCDDIDDTALSYAEVKALATGNPRIKEKMELDMEVAKLKLAKANHDSQKYRMEDNITRYYPMAISSLNEKIAGYKKDIAIYEANRPADKDSFTMTVAGKAYTDKKEAGEALIAFCRDLKTGNSSTTMGGYAGMRLSVKFDTFDDRFRVSVHGNMTYSFEVGKDPLGNITRLTNTLDGITKDLEEAREKLANTTMQLENAKAEVNKPFDKEAELDEKLKRLAELNAELNIDGKEENAADMEDEPDKAKDDTVEEREAKVSEPPVRYGAHTRDMAGDKPSLLAKMETYKEELAVKGGSMEEHRQKDKAVMQKG